MRGVRVDRAVRLRRPSRVPYCDRNKAKSEVGSPLGQEGEEGYERGKTTKFWKISSEIHGVMRKITYATDHSLKPALLLHL
jgi:hypothetical protein